MIVINRTKGWSTAWLRATCAWACEQLDIAAQFPITFSEGLGSGLATYVPTRYGEEWDVKVRLSRSKRYPYVPLDRRLPAIHEWLTSRPEMPLESDEEHLLFILGHELWHLIDPWSATTPRGKRDRVFLHAMEQRCDEAGLKLVSLSRASDDLSTRQSRAVEKESEKNTVVPGNLREMMERVRAARNGG